MKRYRIVDFTFDTRASTLEREIKDDWEEKIKEQHRRNLRNTQQGLVIEYGQANHEIKVSNFKDFGTIPFSIIAFHNKFGRCNLFVA